MSFFDDIHLQKSETQVANLTKENELLKADVAEYKERIQKMLHVFDLIKDNLINTKIGKRVATLISQTGQTAETLAEVCETWSYLLQLTDDKNPNQTRQEQASRT